MTYDPYPQDLKTAAAEAVQANIDAFGKPEYSNVARVHKVHWSTVKKWYLDFITGRNKRQLLAKHIKEQPKQPTITLKHSTVLVIPDLHCPFEHKDSLAFLKAVKARFHPDRILCLGDEADFHAFSRYPMDPNGLNAGQELKEAIEHLKPFYREFPDMMVCTSNHTVRPWLKAFTAGLPEAFWPTYETLLNAPDGWKWKDEWVIDDVLYIHGEGRSGKNAHMQFVDRHKQSVVIGHIHSWAGVQYDSGYFGMNTGCLIDASAYAFKYAKKMPTKVNLGCGLVVNGKYAYFLPMDLDEDNRWTGRL